MKRRRVMMIIMIRRVKDSDGDTHSVYGFCCYF